MDAIFKAVDDFIDARLKAEVERELKANPNVSRESLFADPATVARPTMQFINYDPRFQAFDDATKKRLRNNLTNKKYRSMFLTKPLNEDVVEKEVEAEYNKERGLGTENATVQTMNGLDDYAQKDASNAVDVFSPKASIALHLRGSMHHSAELGHALHILFAAGWVHRDISSNNVMAYRSGRNQAFTLKLADLEFSRPMIDKNRKPRFDPRTGTPFFMPVEILNRDYLFEAYLLAADDEANINLADDLGIDKTSEEYQPLTRFSSIPVRQLKFPANANRDKPAQSGQAVNHGFQHDLESVWWILLWVITCHVNCELSAKAVSRMFKHDVNDFDGRSRAFEKAMNAVNRSLHSDLKGFGSLVEVLREEMYRDYVVRAIVGHLELPESYSNIHAKFATKFREIQAKQGPWRNMKLERRKGDSEDEDKSGVPPTLTGKRSRDASDAEPRRSTRKLKLNGKN